MESKFTEEDLKQSLDAIIRRIEIFAGRINQ